MTTMPNTELIDRAQAVIRPRRVGDYLIGDVGCALISAQGNVYRGVCIDASSGMGFCAEHSAIAAMITAGEYQIAKIVAVWKNDDGDVCVLSPCGRCREFMRQIHPANWAQTDVVLGVAHVVKLADLLPYHDWCQPASI